MAVIEVCDIDNAVGYERNYDVRVCDKCVEKIRAYCRRHKGVMHWRRYQEKE